MAQKRGSGNQKQNPPPDDDVDDDDVGGGSGLDDSIRDELRRMVNATVSSQLGRKLDSAIKGALEGAMAPLTEQLQALTKSKSDKAGGDDDKKLPAKDPELIAMQQKLKKLEDERAAERAQLENRERDTLIREALGKIGVDQNRLRGAVAVIRDSVKKDPSTGEWAYKAQRDGYEEDLDLVKGVSEWGNTEEGKSYRAPVTVKGNNGQQRQAGQVNVIGSRSNGGNDAKGKQAQQQEARAERKDAALDKLSGAVNSLIGGANIDLG